jgi:hypothetical protein
MYGLGLSEEKYNLLRRLMWREYQKNPAYPGDKPTPPGAPPRAKPAKEKPGHWHRKKILGTDTSYCMLPCAKEVAKWAKENGVMEGLAVDPDGGGCQIDFETKLEKEMMNKGREYYECLSDCGDTTEVNVGADAYNMFEGRPFTNLVFRLVQQHELASSHKASVLFGIYEGKVCTWLFLLRFLTFSITYRRI